MDTSPRPKNVQKGGGGGYPLYTGVFCTFSGIPKNRKIGLFGVRIHPFWPKIRPGQAHDLRNSNFMLPGQKKPKNEEKQAKKNPKILENFLKNLKNLELSIRKIL